MEKVIKLYNYVDGVADTPFPNKEEQVEIYTFDYNANRMGGSPYINARIKHRLCLDELWNEQVYAMFNGERFFVVSTPSSSKDNTDERYIHEIQLLSEREVLNHVYFIDAVRSGSDTQVSNSPKVQFSGNIHQFVDRLNASLSSSGLPYTAVVDPEVTSQDKMVVFDKKYVMEALQEAFTTFNIPYYFKNKVIHFGLSEDTVGEPLKYGYDNALMSISKSNANYKLINRIGGMGSADNIPYYYPNDSENRQEVEQSGKKWITPSQNLMPSIYRDTNGMERFYNAENGKYPTPEGGFYTFDNPYTSGNPRESFIDFPEIKPTIKEGKNAAGQRIDMFSEFAYDQNDNDEVDEKGNYLHPYFFGKLRKTDGIYGFNLFAQANEKQPMVVSMTSGVCSACNFQIGVGQSTDKNTVQVDESGNLLRDEQGDVRCGREGKPKEVPQDKQNDTQTNEVWVALKKDTETFPAFGMMPNTERNLKPSTSDTFVLLGITMPKGYILAAEKKLTDSLIKYMFMNNNEKFNFSVKFSRIYFAEHPEVLKNINENSRILLEYNGIQYPLYIDDFSYRVDGNVPLPEIEVNLNETLTSGKNSLQNVLDSIKQDILSSVGGGDFLKQGLKYFLRKDIDDTANGKITFNRGFQSREDAIFAKQSFLQGFLGRGGKIDGEGRAELQSLMIREELIVPKITFNCIDVISGDKANTFAFGTIKSVDKKQQIATLDLLDDQLGTLHVKDICRGIFHDISDLNDADDIEDGNGFYKYSGFSTSYFSPTEILVNKPGEMKFKYIIQDGTKTHPMVGMNFFAYGNFTDKSRQAITYETRYYTRRLKDMSTWNIDPNKNISMQSGLIEGLKIGNMEMHGYGTFQENNYFTGTTIQFTKEQQDELSPYSVSLSSENGVIKVDSKGSVIEPTSLQTEIKATRGSISLTEGQAVTGQYVVGIKSVGCSATSKDGIVTITNLTKEGYVEIAVNCEGQYSITKRYTITSVADGQDGKGSVVSGLDNENSSVAVDSKGQVILGLPVSTHVNIWGDGELLGLNELSAEPIEGIEIQTDRLKREVKVTSIASSLPSIIRIKIRATAIYGGKTNLRNFVFTINKVVQGSDAVINELYLPYTASNEALGIKSINCLVKRTESSGVIIYDTLETTGLSVSYAKNNDNFIPYIYGGFIPISEEDNYVKFRLEQDKKVIDTQTFLVIRNGENGNPGQNAVQYQILPSANVIKKGADGVYEPAEISCAVKIIDGYITRKITSEELKKAGLSISSTIDGGNNPYFGYDMPFDTRHAQNNIKFILKDKDKQIVDSETIPILNDGLKGEDAVVINLTNDNASVACDSEGNVTGVLPHTMVQMFQGSRPLALSEIPVVQYPAGAEGSIYENGSFDVSKIEKTSADVLEFTITAKANVVGLPEPVSRTIVFTVYKSKQGNKGNDGSPSVTYEIVADHSVIKKDKDGNVGYEYLNFHLNEVKGATTTKCIIPEGYKYELYLDGRLYQRYNAGYASEKKVNVLRAKKEFEIRLSKDDGTIVDTETIPVLSDGLQGQAAILMNLTNDNASVECDYQGIFVHTDSAGNIEEGYRPYTIASIYNGTTKVKIKKYEVASRQPVLTQESYTDTSQLDLKVSVFNLDMGSLDREKIDITLYADINGVEERRTIPFFVSKTKNGEKGKDGEKTTIYSIVTSHSVIKRFKNGTSNVVNIDFQINEKDGKVIKQLDRLPMDYNLKIYYDGVLNTTILGGNSCSGSSDVSSIEKSLELKLLRVGGSSDILVDAETIPVLRDGDGESPLIINLTNDNGSIECDSNGNIVHIGNSGYIQADYQPSTTVTLYHGTNPIRIDDIKLITPTGNVDDAYFIYDSVDYPTEATVYVRHITSTAADKEPLKITVSGMVNNIRDSRTATFYVNKVRNGRQGSDGENGKSYQDIFILANEKPTRPSSGYSLPQDWDVNIPRVEYDGLIYNTTNNWSVVNSYIRSAKISSSGFTKERISFNFSQETYVEVEMTSHSEARYDIGFIGKLDSTYSSKPSDSSILNKVSGDNVKVHSYVRVPAGSHFIEVMYTKDSSGDKFGDYVDVRVLALKRIWTSRSEMTYENSASAWYYNNWSEPRLYNVESGEESIYLLTELKVNLDAPYSDPDIDKFLPLITYNKFDPTLDYAPGEKTSINDKFYESIKYNEGGFPPTNTEYWKEIATWTREPKNIDDKYHYQYICVRKQSQTVWGNWSKPALFTSVGEKGKDGGDTLPVDRGFFKQGEHYYWKEVVVDGVKKTYRDKVVALVGERYYNFLVRHFGSDVTAAPTLTNGEQAGTGGDENWELMSEYKSLIVNTLFGKNANIGGFMTTDERFESSSQVDGKPKFEINGRQGTQVMRQEGGTEWSLDENGVQSVGKPNGERVVIDPASKSISIYDEKGSERANLNGKSYTKNELITSGNLTFTKTSDAVSNISRDKTLSHGNNDVYEERINLTNALYVSSPESVQVSLNDVSVGLDDRADLSPNENVSDYTRLDIFLDVFSDSALKKRVSYKLLTSVECRVKKAGGSDSTYPSSLGDVSVSLEKGYCVFAARITMIAVNRIVGRYTWNFNVGSIAKDNFISRYFSNGFCLSRSTKDYVTALSENNRMMFEAVSNGFGARVYDGNFSIKHSESQQWFNMPKILFVANVQAVAYNNYNVKIKTFDGSAITFSGGVGRCSFTLPSQWRNLGISPSTVIANATSYGRINGAYNENVCWTSIEYLSSASIDIRTAFGKGSDYQTCGFFLEVRLL